MLDLPPFFLDHLALTKTPAFISPQIAESADPLPLIIFSHGWKGFSAASSGQAIELASQGYVVIAMQHTYGAITAVFPDGTVAPINPDALPAEEDDPNYEEIARRLVAQWADDISFVLYQLESSSGEAGSFFAGILDLSRIGVYGHSTGGGAAIQFCGTDPRCKAVLGMDPWMRPVSAEVIAGGVRQPAFFMFSEEWAQVVGKRNKNNFLFNQFRPNISDNRGVIEILGTSHLDFSDLPLLSPIAPLLGLKGPLRGERVIEIVDAYLVDFFGMTLMDQPSGMFSGSFEDFAEVRVWK
jgi:pimeloyl-ACP methyl ester carboxylesterase